jgi:hypothetical protein
MACLPELPEVFNQKGVYTELLRWAYLAEYHARSRMYRRRLGSNECLWIGGMSLYLSYFIEW